MDRLSVATHDKSELEVVCGCPAHSVAVNVGTLSCGTFLKEGTAYDSVDDVGISRRWRKRLEP